MVNEREELSSDDRILSSYITFVLKISCISTALTTFPPFLLPILTLPMSSPLPLTSWPLHLCMWRYVRMYICSFWVHLVMLMSCQHGPGKHLKVPFLNGTGNQWLPGEELDCIILFHYFFFLRQELSSSGWAWNSFHRPSLLCTHRKASVHWNQVHTPARQAQTL